MPILRNRSTPQPPSLAYGGSTQGLRLPADSETEFPLTVPANGVVEFGMMRHGDDGSALRGEVAVRSPERGEEVFFSEQSVDQSTTWRADLSQWAGEQVNVVFRTVGGQLGDGVTWTQPALYGEIGAMNVRSNVVLIVIDTLRADHLGAYGGDVETPNMDALAQRGVLFEHAYSHIPITVPSHSSMFTSLIPTEHATPEQREHSGGASLDSGRVDARVLSQHHRVSQSRRARERVRCGAGLRAVPRRFRVGLVEISG